MSSRGRKGNNPVRAYFSFDAENDTSQCIIKVDGDICGLKLKANHAPNLERHVSTKHPVEFCEITRTKVNEKRKRCDSDSADNATKNRKSDTFVVRFRETDVLDACVDLVTVNGRPFTLVEDNGFRKLLNPIVETSPNRIAINAENIRSEIVIRAQCIRREIQSEIAGWLICLKVDTAMRLGRSFLGVNIQYIRDEKILLRALCAKELFSAHTAVNLKHEILCILAMYGLNVKSLYSVTTGNASNMLKCVQLLGEDSDESEMSDGHKIEEDCEVEHLMLSEEEESACVTGVRCAAHLQCVLLLKQNRF